MNANSIAYWITAQPGTGFERGLVFHTQSLLATHGRPVAIDLSDLPDAQIGATFNQYRESDGDDAGPESPGIRSANLLAYLSARRDAPVLLVAEAAGWRGARYSGLCLFCERQFSDAEPELRRSSRHPHGWSEPSATVVQAAIAPWRDRVVLWNLVPTHPRLDANPHTNRTPTRDEVRQGEVWLRRLMEGFLRCPVGNLPGRPGRSRSG